MAHPVSAGHKCSGKAVSTMRVSMCASPLSSPHPGRMLRCECLHLPPFFALPFALFPPCLLSLCKCLVMFCPRSKKGVPSCCSLPSRQTRFVLELVLNASYCNSNKSVRPRERWVVSAYATWPRPESTPGIQATLLYAGLTLAGAMQLQDFCNHVVLQEDSI